MTFPIPAGTSPMIKFRMTLLAKSGIIVRGVVGEVERERFSVGDLEIKTALNSLTMTKSRSLAGGDSTMAPSRLISLAFSWQCIKDTEQ